MNTGYTIYQVERTKSAAEQREVDRSNAELAAAISRLWRALAAPWRARAVPWRARRAARRRPVWVTAPRVSAETSHAIASDVSAETPGHEAMRNGPGACPAGPDGRGQYAPAGAGHHR
jgi:hypothetical protein